MTRPTVLFIAISLGTFCVSGVLPTQAQSSSPRKVITAPDYGSGASAGPLADSNFNTPESDGRPGVYFFGLASQAFHKHEYKYAVDMFKVAASWAYKPAQYDLGLMYFKGQGVPVNRALGAAWMVLAAERGDPIYIKARDLMVTALTDAQFAETDKLWAQLRKTYGDKVALHRAEAQWERVASRETGTHVRGGIAGNLTVGVFDGGHASGQTKIQAQNAFGLMQSGSIDASVAYRQFKESNNPYSPIFLKSRKGTATIGPLQQIESGAGETTSKSAPPSSGQQ